MALVDWQSIETDRLVVTARLDRLLCIVVAVDAQRLQLAELEQVPIASMWHNVIDNSCCCAAALRLADRTERASGQLEGSAAFPDRELVPTIPMLL